MEQALVATEGRVVIEQDGPPARRGHVRERAAQERQLLRALCGRALRDSGNDG